MICSRVGAPVIALVGLLLLAGSGAVAADRAVRLTSDNLYKRDPLFTDGGQHLVYVVLERPEQLRLMRMDMADGSAVPLHPDETRSELEPAFSADGRYYAFLQSRSAASVGMVIRDTVTKTDAELAPAGGFSGMRSPAFSPDGRRVVYAFADGGRQHLFSIDVHAGDLKQLTDLVGLCNWPHFSPDGKQIVFGSTRDGNYEIYIIGADGSDPRRLTDNPFQDIRPKFSPDGKRIVFTSARDGNYEIYTIGVDGSGLSRVTDHPERDDYPAWHPDGKRLVVVSERRGRHDLYLIDVP